MRSLIVVVSLIVLIAGTVWARNDRLFRRTKAYPYCEIPNYNYQAPRPVTPIVGEVTALALPVQPAVPVVAPVPPATAVPVNIQVFQMQKAVLQNDHCTISQMAITTQDDGGWIVNFQARQDPMMLPPNVQPTFELFKRNKFTVIVRAIALAPLAETPAQSVLGKPVLYEIPFEFWVERGQTRLIREQGNCTGVKAFYNTVQRFEVYFRYE